MKRLLIVGLALIGALMVLALTAVAYGQPARVDACEGRPPVYGDDC